MPKTAVIHDENILNAMKKFLKTGQFSPLKMDLEKGMVGALSFLALWNPTDEEFVLAQGDADGKLVLTS